jgi:hypothetical protein
VTLFGEMADYMPGFERLSDRSDYLLTVECIRHGPFCKLPNVRKRSLFACRLRQLNTWKFSTIGQVGTRRGHLQMGEAALHGHGAAAERISSRPSAQLFLAVTPHSALTYSNTILPSLRSRANTS